MDLVIIRAHQFSVVMEVVQMRHNSIIQHVFTLDSVSNSLLVVNYVANNTVRFRLGENVWTLVAGNISGFSGTTSRDFSGPIDVTLDPMGNIYIADRYNHRIQFFSNG